MAPHPKRKRSKSRQGTHAAHSAIHASSMSPCPQCHSPRLPHRACPVCGTYAGRQVLAVEPQQE